MSRFKHAVITTALVAQFFISTNLGAKSSVWKISKGADYFYLGGTFHILSPDDHPLPEEFLIAYSDATEVIFETDMEATTSAAFQREMLNAMTFRDGRTLQGELKADTYERLKQFMVARQLPVESMAGFQPWAVSLVLAMQEYMNLGMEEQFGVEAYLSQRAPADNKTLQSLETPQQHLQFFSSLASIDPDTSINYTLRDLKNAPDYIRELKKAWRDGNLEMMQNNSAVVNLKQDFPDVYETLLLKRNENWMKQLVHLYDDDAIEVVLVGAMHLVGDGGLIKLLQSRGFTVEQLE